MKHLRTLALCVGLSFLSACSFIAQQFDNHAMGYLDAQEYPQMPKQALIEAPYSQAYPVADGASAQAPKKFVLVRPEPLDIKAADKNSYNLSTYAAHKANPSLGYDGAGTRILKLHTPFALSWSEVLKALNRSSFKVTDMNRNTGVYYLEMPQKADKTNSSWWRRLFYSDSTVMQTFLLKMDKTPEGVLLSLLTDGDTLANPQVTENVLTEIRDKLIQ